MVLPAALRDYWAAALYAATAIVLLALGGPSKAAMAGAGFALFGAAGATALDIARQHCAEAARADESRRRDLDETRRLAYMALASRHTERYELTATVVNALTYHQSVVDPDTAIRHVATVVDSGPGDPGESEAWLRGHIDRITSELGPI